MNRSIKNLQKYRRRVSALGCLSKINDLYHRTFLLVLHKLDKNLCALKEIHKQKSNTETVILNSFYKIMGI